MSKFAERLRLVRDNKGLTLDDIAIGIGSTKSALSHYENGKRSASQTQIMKISEYLGVSADYLLGLIDDENGRLGEKKPTQYHQIAGGIREFLSDKNVPQSEKDNLFKEMNNVYWKNKE